MSDSFCAWCGGAAAEGDHAACQRRRVLEPPRYCPHCARRMVVQVTPAGWTARCSAHGASSSDSDRAASAPTA
ncbi:biotin synthase auxiliary protein BsaP [Streptoalloteichus hindustanus]|uniref:Biotin synthase auxiliary protein n=1 Tax=Streptoalloteichus hindustanus TaxID=2017 RepID=A0A1M5ARZ4_STRHI|nr:hypothetical protein [Streptoalloteichus hindustanus]SHF33013.1 hypothetical protein SAMN05444320_103238 [Streptoalloteichus hindustanus]